MFTVLSDRSLVKCSQSGAEIQLTGVKTHWLMFVFIVEVMKWKMFLCSDFPQLTETVKTEFTDCLVNHSVLMMFLIRRQHDVQVIFLLWQIGI